MDVLLGIASCAAGLYFLAPVMLFVRAWSITKYMPYQYAFTLLSCGMWIPYGVRHKMPPTYLVNTGGAILNTIYVILFLTFSARAEHRRRYLCGFLVMGAIIFGVTMLIDLLSHTLYDGICSAVSCLVSLAPFWNVCTALSERKMDVMPPVLTPALCFFNAGAWTLRNTKVDWKDVNLHVVIPSSFAALCAFVQVMLHIAFWQQPAPPRTGTRAPLIPAEERVTKEEDDEGNDKNEGGEGHKTDLRQSVASPESSTGVAMTTEPAPPQTGIRAPLIATARIPSMEASVTKEEDEDKSDKTEGHDGHKTDLRLSVKSLEEMVKSKNKEKPTGEVHNDKTKETFEVTTELGTQVQEESSTGVAKTTEPARQVQSQQGDDAA